MEVFVLEVVRGNGSHVDAGGGVHIEGFPQLVSVRRKSWLARMSDRLAGLLGRRRLESMGCSVYGGEFVVEVPLTVDVSPITGIRNSEPVRLRFMRANSVEDVAQEDDL